MMTLYVLLASPLVAGLSAALFGRWARRQRLVEGISVAGALATCVAGLLVVGEVASDRPRHALGGLLTVDALSALLVLVIVVVGLFATVVSVGYLRHDVRHGETGPDQASWYHLGL